MTTSATKIVSATDNTNRNNNYNNNNNNNNNNTNHNHNIRERRNSDASNNSYKITNNNNNNNNKINDKNTSSTGTNNLTAETTTTNNHNNEYVALKTQTPVAMVEQQQQQQQNHQLITDMSTKHEAALIIPNTTTTTTSAGAPTMSIPTTTPNIVQNGIINLTTSSSSLSSSGSTTRAMQSDEDFNIRFVNLVRLHKCLYDKKVPEYRNRDNQEKAWSLISQETRESVIHCKERWRNLRACLSRYIKQQSGSDPQHKPYYLTEHMAFLLPFLKSTRGGNTMNYSLELHQQLTNNNSSQQSNNLSALFPISATGGVNPMHLSAMTVIPLHNTTVPAGGVQIKHSLSENDDEETIDAFDPAITGTLQQQQEEAINLHQYPQHYQHQQQLRQRMSPALSDTASANSLQHFIPDVQLSEAPSSEYNQNHHHHHHPHHQNHNSQNDSNHHHHNQLQHQPHHAKRIKLECDGSNNSVNGRICVCGLDSTVANNPDMEFFRSILPDIAFLSAQQKRKLKIGILELIDDVAARYPGQATTVTTTSSNLNMVTSTPVTNHLNGRQRNLIDRSK